MFMQLIDAYDWDFCQIQYNYMDEHSQAGVEGTALRACEGIPVIIMEPLRGGRLVNLLPESAKELFAQDEEHRTPAELALKWLYDQPEVTCVLSGMNSMEMVEQNVRTASEYGVGCMTESDRALVEAVRQEITKHVKVGCTGCGYCMPCPRGVDIPGHSAATMRCTPKEKVRPQGLSAVYGIPQESGERLTVCGMRQMRAALSAAYRDPRGVKSGGGRTRDGEVQVHEDGNRRAEALVETHNRKKAGLEYDGTNGSIKTVDPGKREDGCCIFRRCGFDILIKSGT